MRQDRSTAEGAVKVKWKPVKRRCRHQPMSGKYSDWKDQIARDCHHQCVYCAIHESHFGGLDNFHVDHFRPKSRFRNLEHIITNLFLACSICNRFKSDDWPDEPKDDHSVPAYPDPSKHDYNDLFKVTRDHKVAGRFPASAYVTDRLYLNRPQLVMERRIHVLDRKMASLEDFARNASVVLRKQRTRKNAVIDILAELTSELATLNGCYRAVHDSRPYRLDQIRRITKAGRTT